MMLKFVLGKKRKLIEVARLSREKKIKKISGKRYWVKKKEENIQRAFEERGRR